MSSIPNLLPTEIRQIAHDYLVALFEALKKPCKLVYPPKMIPCSACTPDATGKKSSGFWKDGTRIRGVCSYCGGNYFKAQEVSESVFFLTQVDTKKFEKFPFEVPLRDPGGLLQIKGYMEDLPKVLKCEYLIHDLNMQPFIEQRYKMVGEPISPSNIVKNVFFVALFERY